MGNHEEVKKQLELAAAFEHGVVAGLKWALDRLKGETEPESPVNPYDPTVEVPEEES